MSNYKDKEWLKDKIQKGFTQKQIAEMCGLRSTSTIAYMVKKFQIKQTKNPLHDKEWLYHQYIVLNKTAIEIAKEINTRPQTVSSWTQRYMLNKKQSVRLNSYQDKRWLYKQLIELNMDKRKVASISNVSIDSIQFWIEKYNIIVEKPTSMWSEPVTNKLFSEKWLHDEYIIKDKSALEIGNDIGVSKSTVLRKLRKFGIQKEEKILIVQCDNCLTEFRINNFRLERSQFHYCSVNCKNQHNSIALNKQKIYYNKEWLYKNLVVENKSFKELEKEIGISYITIMQVASKLGIKKKDMGLQGNKNQELTILLKNKKWLKHQYITLDKDIEDLSKEFGFGKTTVARYLKRFSLIKEGDPRKGFHSQVILECSKCKKKIRRKVSRLNANFNSCSKECYDILYKKWFRESGHMEKLLEGNRKYYETPQGQEMRKLSGMLGALALSEISETYIEKIIRTVLDRMNISYIAQHPMGYYVVDFYLPNFNLVIEINGDYWHWNPEVYGGGNSFAKNHEKRSKR